MIALLALCLRGVSALAADLTTNGGVPLYMCGGGTIQLLQQWLVDGMSMGSAAAFMITGRRSNL